ncbi:MAG: site-specific integrase [Acidobacteria bacterium]|nr:site-specific integrase [Acidobacteriota bacterium]
MDGSFRQAGLGRDEQTGKSVCACRTITGNKKDAQGWAIEDERERDLLGTGAINAAGFTVGDLLDDLVRDYEENGKSLGWCKIVANVHLRPVFGKLSVSKLSTAAVRAYMDQRRAKGRANGTINRELSLPRRALNLGSRATPPKVARVLFIPELKEDNTRKGFFEHSEFMAVRAVLPDHLKPVLTFACFTGCRKGEILSLQWPQMDLIERIVRPEVGTTKNDEGRIIPLAPELYQVLSIEKEKRDQRYPACPWVFHIEGRRFRGFTRAWATACWEAGLWTGDEETGEPSKLFHDLRRTGVRNLIRAGVPEAVAMRISGHKTRSMLDRYNIVTESDLKDAARKLGEYISGREAAEKNEAESHAAGKSRTIVAQGQKRETVQ